MSDYVDYYVLVDKATPQAIHRSIKKCLKNYEWIKDKNGIKWWFDGWDKYDGMGRATKRETKILRCLVKELEEK